MALNLRSPLKAPKFVIMMMMMMKTGLAKISTHSTSWKFKTIKLIQKPLSNTGQMLMVPRSIPTSPNLK